METLVVSNRSPEEILKSRALQCGLKEDASEAEVIAKEKEIEEANKERARFCHLDSFGADTYFMDINYNEGKQGRTVLILGQMGLHYRATGQFNAKVHKENLGLTMDEEIDYDVLMSLSRNVIIGCTVIKHRVKLEEAQDPEQKDRIADGEKIYIWNLLISHVNGSITISGLQEDFAITQRKIIWKWMHHFQA